MIDHMRCHAVDAALRLAIERRLIRADLIVSSITIPIQPPILSELWAWNNSGLSTEAENKLM